MPVPTSHMDPGIAGASQSRPSGAEQPNPPGTSRPERLPRPSATQPAPARDNLAHPSHGVAEASRDRPIHERMSLARPKDHGVARASRDPTVVGSNNTLVPPGVCGTWPLLAVWDPRCRPTNNSAHQICRPVNYANGSSQLQHQTVRCVEVSVPQMNSPETVNTSVTRLRFTCFAPAELIDSSTKPFAVACDVTEAAKPFSAFARSAFPASSNVVNSVTSAIAFSRALLNCASWSSRDCLSTANE